MSFLYKGKNNGGTIWRYSIISQIFFKKTGNICFLHYYIRNVTAHFQRKTLNQLETTNMARPKKEGAENMAKRVRRGFAQIIVDKISKKYDGAIDPAKLQTGLDEIEKIIATLDELKKAKKKDFKALKKFSKEEIEAYLATLK